MENTPKVTEFEIINHGYEHGQYFQGCGVFFSRFEHVVTGIGANAAEAYADAVEMIWTDADASALPKRPRGIRKSDRVPAECMGEDSEVWWRVSIRYNVEEES